MVDLTYRSDLDRNLNATEADTNLRNINDAIVALQNDRPQPAEFETISFNDALEMRITLDNGTEFGPFQFRVPGGIRIRFSWEPFTHYDPLDTFAVETLGIYTVLRTHTSGADFDPALLVSGLPAYELLFGPGAGSDIVPIYDIGVFYQALLSDAGSDNLWEFLAPRKLLIPAASSQHLAQLKEAPSTAAQVMPVYHNGTQIGHVDFAIGDNVGTVTITADETVLRGDVVELGPPALVDATAKGLSVVFAAQRVL